MTILLYFFEKKVDFQIFFSQFFLQILLANFFDNFFLDFIFLNCHFDGNAYGEFKNFQKFKKKMLLGLKKHCSGYFLKQLGSFFHKASILTHRFHSE